MDINTLRGLSTLVLLIAFIALVFWAYSGRRKKSFDEAAQLPFADEAAHRQTLQSDRQTAQMAQSKDADKMLTIGGKDE